MSEEKKMILELAEIVARPEQYEVHNSDGMRAWRDRSSDIEEFIEKYSS